MKKRPQVLTLNGGFLDGYSGRMTIIAYPRRRWWHRLLRRWPEPRIQRVYATVSRDVARVWPITR